VREEFAKVGAEFVEAIVMFTIESKKPREGDNVRRFTVAQEEERTEEDKDSTMKENNPAVVLSIISPSRTLGPLLKHMRTPTWGALRVEYIFG
jgi:hypothetical protein